METSYFINESRKIYNALGDKKSKFIFRERLLYSCTNEPTHIRNVINTLDAGKWFDNKMQSNNKCYIFGAGTWGKEIVQAWPNQWAGFLDNNSSRWGTKIQGIPVYCPNDILTKDIDANIVISSRLYYKEIHEQLLELGIPESNIINVGEVLDVLAERQYFDLSFLKLDKNEVFADIGSFDGMSAKRFLKWVNNEFDRIYCFEPDKRNVHKCEKNLEEFITKNKVEIINKGAWSSEKILRFQSHGNGTSSFVITDGKIDDEVEVTTMDKIFQHNKVTFIKMDIEGAEYEALKGCENIIKLQQPKLAICIYHKPEDIFVLPQLILEYNPNYKLFIRHYSITAAETVLYAI